MLAFQNKFDSLTQEQCDAQIDEILELADDVELRLLKQEVIY